MINLAHLHPVLVHLPIGIFILTALIYFLKGALRLSDVQSVIRLSLLIGIFTTLLSAGTGLLLSQKGNYPPSLINIHLLSGVAVLVTASLIWVSYAANNEKLTFLRPFLFAMLVAFIGTAGHFGGTLTHGSGFLFQFPETAKALPDSGNVATSQRSTHIVEIKQMKFIPDSILVNPGDTITFINKDFVKHDVTEEINREWTSSVITPGSSWSMVAKDNVDYFCSLHVVMEGKIRLK